MNCNWDVNGTIMQDGERVELCDPSTLKNTEGTIHRITNVRSVVTMDDGREVEVDNISVLSLRSKYPGRQFRQPASAFIG